VPVRFFFKTKILSPPIFYFISPFAPLYSVFPTLCLSLFFFTFSSKIPPCNIFLRSFPVFSSLFFLLFFFLLCVVVLSFFLLSSSPLPFLLHLSSSIYKQKEREATLPCLVKVQGYTRVVWGGFCTATPTTAGYGFFLPFYMMAGEGVHGCI